MYTRSEGRYIICNLSNYLDVTENILEMKKLGKEEVNGPG